jgi:hypothetical protein
MHPINWILEHLGLERGRTMNGTNRARAWFVATVSSDMIQGLRAGLRSLDAFPDGKDRSPARDDLAVVRIDRVEDQGGTERLMIPVDAADGEGLQPFDEIIKVLDEFGAEYEVFRVTEHEPGGEDANRPPHLAGGYITEGEFAADNEHQDKRYYGERGFFGVTVSHGRQIGSPGFTPWG